MAKEDVIARLDEIRRAEITASIQYMAHHSELEHLGVDKLAKQMRKEAVEEMKHAEALAERIFYLGGRPSHTPLKDAEDSTDVLEMIRQDIRLEEDAITRLNEAIAFCITEKDAGTRSLLEGILADEEHHLEELTQIIDISERLGPAGFMMCICGSGVPAPGVPQ